MATSELSIDELAEQDVQAVNVARATLAWVACGRAVATGDAPS